MAEFHSSNAYQRQNGGGAGNPYHSNPYGANNSAPNNDPYNASQWQSSAQAQQNSSQPYEQENQQQRNGPQQQQGQGGSTPFWSPAMSQFVNIATTAAVQNAGTNNPNAMLDAAGKIGHTFLDEGTARMIPGLENMMRQLRVYFAVDNNYVKKKMTRVLFSFFFKNWERLQNDGSDPSAVGIYALPNQDDNALDLYIPLMSFITYILLCALCFGTSGEFSPEVLTDQTTKCFVILILEVLLLRLGYYMMQVSVSFLDLFAVSGYKFLGLSINMFVGFSLSLALTSGGHKGYYGTFIWTASAMSYFMLRFIGYNIPAVTNASGPKKEIVVLAFAGFQFASMYFLGQTKFLN